MSKHSTTVGGSSAERLINCPASHAIAKTLPPRAAGAYADEGSMMHAAMEQLMAWGAAELIGFESHGHTLNGEQAEELEVARGHWNEIHEGVGEWDQEVRVAFKSKDLEGAFGTADVLAYNEDKELVYLTDWKFGRGVPVAAEDEAGPNKQLLFYASAWRDGLDMNDERRDWDFVLTIIQPAFGAFTVEVPNRVVATFAATLARAMKAIEKPDAQISAGSWCRWCPAKPACPLLGGFGEMALQVTPSTMDPELISEWLDRTGHLEQWIHDVRALAQEHLEQGQEVPGWKLVAKRATRKWIDDAAALTALRALSYKIRVKDVTTPKLNGIVAIEKFLKKLGKEIPEELVTKTSSGTTLAPDSDKRPAAITGMAALKDLGQRLLASS